MRIEGAIRQCEWQRLQECLKIFLQEEKTNTPHTYSLEEISKVFRMRIEEVRLLYDILEYKLQDENTSRFHEGIWQSVLI